MDMNKVDVTHDEHAVPAADAHVDLAEEQIREQIAAQIRVSKLRWYSKSSIQLYIIFAITYCSMFPKNEILVERLLIFSPFRLVGYWL